MGIKLPSKCTRLEVRGFQQERRKHPSTSPPDMKTTAVTTLALLRSKDITDAQEQAPEGSACEKHCQALRNCHGRKNKPATPLHLTRASVGSRKSIKRPL